MIGKEDFFHQQINGEMRSLFEQHCFIQEESQLPGSRGNEKNPNDLDRPLAKK